MQIEIDPEFLYLQVDRGYGFIILGFQRFLLLNGFGQRSIGELNVLDVFSGFEDVHLHPLVVLFGQKDLVMSIFSVLRYFPDGLHQRVHFLVESLLLGQSLLVQFLKLNVITLQFSAFHLFGFDHYVYRVDVLLQTRNLAKTVLVSVFIFDLVFAFLSLKHLVSILKRL